MDQRTMTSYSEGPDEYVEQTPLLNNNGHGPTPLAVEYGISNNTSSSSNSINQQHESSSKNNDSKRLSSIASHIPSVPSQHAIGFLGSIAIAVNSLTGPAMVNLPATFQTSGLIPTTITIVLVCFLSSLCSLHMADTISKVPGNANFAREVEFSEAFKIFWGQRWFVLTQVIFFCCVTCLNISSMVDTAQVVDTFLGHWSPTGSGAIQWLFLPPSSCNIQWVHWDPSVSCTEEERVDGECIPFSHHADGLLLTVGYLTMTMIFFPMALMDLKENSAWQVFGFMVLLVTCVQFVIQFLSSAGVDGSNVSWWGDNWNDLFGVVLFNFSLVIAVPAWLYEKKPSVDVPTVVHGASILSAILYIVVGALGALSIPNVSNNMLESMMSGVFGPTMQLGSSFFAFMIIGLGIPLFSVLTRMSLEGSGLVSHSVGNILAVYLPFSISWMLYQGVAVTKLLSWGGVVFTSAVAFLLPLVLALHTVQEFDREGSISVYGRWTIPRSTQIFILKVLLALATVSVGFAVFGEIFLGDS